MSQAPLTDADCDLTDFSFMPLDVARLRDSELALYGTPDACWANVLLMAASWREIPAASAPGDDKAIAKLIGYTAAQWRRVREQVLKEWVGCTDGRWYHPALCAAANRAWAVKQARMRRIIRRLELESQEWQALRLLVFRRDGFVCGYCGSNDKLEADHIVPVASGGPSILSNLMTACRKCNRSKGSKSLERWRAGART